MRHWPKLYLHFRWRYLKKEIYTTLRRSAILLPDLNGQKGRLDDPLQWVEGRWDVSKLHKNKTQKDDTHA
jgi:hypothetical protein